MSPEELIARECIRHTMACYTMAGDRLRVDEFVAVFTEDGVLESDGADAQDSFRYEGRDQIRGWLGRWTQRAHDAAAPTHAATFVRHHLSSSMIEFTAADAAKARTYWTAYTDIGPDHCGYYLDEFRNTGGEWLIAHRRVRLDWRSPQSLFTTAVTRSR